MFVKLDFVNNYKKNGKYMNKLSTKLNNNKKLVFLVVFPSLITALLMLLVFAGLLATNTISMKGNAGWLSSLASGTIKTDSAAEESQVISVVEKANPAVVSIIISKDVPTFERYYMYGMIQNGTEKQEVGGGSGFFISSDGYIVTNTHVVADASADYTVMTSDGTKHSAKVIAKDSTQDVAVIKIDGTDYPYLNFGDSANLKPGQSVIAIGNALAQYSNSVSVGIVSGLSRSIVAGDGNGNSEQLSNVIQTDAGINAGNSGGPLLDLRGNVIGVNVAMEQGAENISFALPSNTVKNIVDSIKKYGKVVKPYLGVRYTAITPAVKQQNNLSVDYGVIVARGQNAGQLAVIPGSPADKAGIVENDIILEIDGTKLDSTKSLASIIGQKQIGDSVKVKLLHDGKEKTVDVKLEQAPDSVK